MAQLILVRHGITDWNKEGKWHGQTDISINDEGKAEALKDGETIKDLKVDKVYVSALRRTQETFAEINKVLNLSVPVIKAAELNERDYGIYNGKNKWEVKQELGEEQFNHLRRDWDCPIPNGESLKQVYERVIPYYQQHILPELISGQNILMVSSGNTLRALTKYLEKLPDESISQTQLNFGEVDIYDLDPEGNILNKQTRASELFQGKH